MNSEKRKREFQIYVMWCSQDFAKGDQYILRIIKKVTDFGNKLLATKKLGNKRCTFS